MRLGGSGPRLAVAWNDETTGSGVLQALGTHAPWEFQPPPLQIGPDSVARSAGGRVYVVSRTAGTIAVVAADTWTTLAVYSVGPGSEPLDIAVVNSARGYVSRAGATQLLRLDLLTGESEEVVDLGVFADADGVPDMGMMALHEGRLFVQIRRINFDEPGWFAPPAYLAVVDTASEQLIDVDPATPGLQAIELQGTPPKHKMQIVPQTRQLFVSASGDFFDDGGIEIVDLDTLQSVGMPVREYDGNVGADLGSFVMVSPDRGYLVFSTDLVISSHLVAFTVSGGVEPGPGLYDSIGYRVPTMVHDLQTDTFFYPDGGYGGEGVHVFDALTGTRLTADAIATTGQPTDLAMLCEGLIDCDDPNCVSDPACLAIPATSRWSLAVMALLLLLGAAVLLGRRPRHAAH
jgi:hypothetical protein